MLTDGGGGGSEAGYRVTSFIIIALRSPPPPQTFAPAATTVHGASFRFVSEDREVVEVTVPPGHMRPRFDLPKGRGMAKWTEEAASNLVGRVPLELL